MTPRLALLNTLSRLVMKPAVAMVPDPVGLRAMFDQIAALGFRPPPHTLISEITLAGRPALSIRNRPGSHPAHRARVILFLHGGGFIAGSPGTHAAMLARLARLTGLEVVAPDYRLAPEAPFPAARDDARAAFDALVARGHAPGDIVLGGDSAGGNLALGLLSTLCTAGTPPAGLFAYSPVTDLSFSGASIGENRSADPMLPFGRAGDLVRYYLPAGVTGDDPRVSPHFAEFPNPPPVLLQFSSTEILRDDSRRMADKLRAAGGVVIEDEWARTPHVWQIFDGWVPEARQALESTAWFIRELWDTA